MKVNRIKFSSNGYGDFSIFVLALVKGDLVWVEVGIIEKWNETAKHKYAVYINSRGKITDNGYDVFSLKTAKETAKKYIIDSNLIQIIESGKKF